MLEILNLYDLKLVSFDKVKEENDVVKVNDYIKSQFNTFGLNEKTTNKQIQQFYKTVTGLSSKNMSVKQKKKYLYDYFLDDMVKNHEISLQQRKKFEKEFNNDIKKSKNMER